MEKILGDAAMLAGSRPPPQRSVGEKEDEAASGALLPRLARAPRLRALPTPNPMASLSNKYEVSSRVFVVLCALWVCCRGKLFALGGGSAYYLYGGNIVPEILL